MAFVVVEVFIVVVVVVVLLFCYCCCSVSTVRIHFLYPLFITYVLYKHISGTQTRSLSTLMDEMF